MRAPFTALSSKQRFRRSPPKSYSYRYEIAATAGPPGDPLVNAGAAILETRYRGHSASWKVAQSMMSAQAWSVSGAYVAPLPENPMAYAPRVAPVVAAPDERFVAATAPTPPAAPPEPVPVPERSAAAIAEHPDSATLPDRAKPTAPEPSLAELGRALIDTAFGRKTAGMAGPRG